MDSLRNWKWALVAGLVAQQLGAVGSLSAQSHSLDDTAGTNHPVAYSAAYSVASGDACGCDAASGCAASCGGNPCDDACDPCAAEPWRLFPESACGFSITGWMAGGAVANAGDPVSRYNGVTTFPDRNEVMLNQLYLVMQRPTDTSEEFFDIGGRLDLLFGTDYIFTQAVGLETDLTGAPKWNNHRFYGLAMPQAYVEVAAGDLAVKVGHFYTIIGNESVMAPNNFFYTHAYTMQYGEPFTHTGVLATYALSDQLSVTTGIHNGWDIFDRASERAGLLTGFTWKSFDERTTLSFGLTAGDEFNAQAIPTYSNRTMYSLVATRQVTDRLQVVLQHDCGWNKDYSAPGVDAEWYGLHKMVFYTINDCWKWGARAEWFRDDDGARVTGVRADNPVAGASFVGDFYEISTGLNWTPTANLVVRPEIRWDWFEGTGLPFDDGGNDHQFLAAFDAILHF